MNALNVAEYTQTLGLQAKTAAAQMARASAATKNKALKALARLLRDNVVIHEGTLSTLKRFKDEVKEVVVGQECGMAFDNYQDIQQGDQIECFEVETVKRTL